MDTARTQDPGEHDQAITVATLDDGVAFDRITGLTAALLRTPMALFNVLDGESQTAIGQTGLAVAARRRRPVGQSLCRVVVGGAVPVAVDDVREDPLAHGLTADGELTIAAYIGHPVRDASGAVVGALCGVDRVPRAWTPAEGHALGELAALVEAELRLRDGLRRQTATSELLARTARALFRALDQAAGHEAERADRRPEHAYALGHGVRTPLYSIRGLVEVLRDFEDRVPDGLVEDIDAIDASARAALAAVDEELQGILDDARPTPVPAPVDVPVVLEAVAALQPLRIRVDPVPEAARSVRSDALRCAQVLHLLAGAAAASSDGELVLSAAPSADGVRLRVRGGGPLAPGALDRPARLARDLPGAVTDDGGLLELSVREAPEPAG